MFDRIKKILFKAIYIVIVMGAAVSHSPGAQRGLNAALGEGYVHVCE